MKLTKIYNIRESIDEATPFDSQKSSMTTTSSWPKPPTGTASQAITRPEILRKLNQVDDILSTINDVGATGSKDLDKIINDFIIALIPFLSRDDV